MYGDLRDGVEALIRKMNVNIEEETGRYSIDIFPKNASGGHGFSFTVDRKTGKRSDVVVGGVLPEPDVDN